MNKCMICKSFEVVVDIVGLFKIKSFYFVGIL